ncbi:LPS-assembly protein LptD [Pelosinus baikalensis]|uniref:LPS-assembly protein LptD n=1 Tax=Pelosinus baikalensis TaxID=2892015 RepID=A0ABS8HLW2_9FIRM|nr:LPS-assembly protein LptD [Pelosinus baikalensis]MCC5464161.1 LPS-assembly protein LptD [Pelosinus baikalensis]
MQIKKFMVCASVLMLVSSASMAGQAADKENNEIAKSKTDSQENIAAKEEKKAPIVIEAEKLSFSEETGDVFAEGNVVVKQNTDVISTDFMRGNNKTTEVWIDGKATLQQPGTELVGTGTHYNYTTRIGNMNNVKGLVGNEHISSNNLEFYPEKYIGHDSTATKCPAIVPDYHMSADRIEIWPGEKMVAYNAKFWIKNVVIYSMPKYQTSLKKGEAKSAFPSIGYHSGDGLTISQHLEYPIEDKLTAFADLDYYSQHGLKPSFGLTSKQKGYSLKLYQSNEENGDDEWIKKEAELLFTLDPIKMGKVTGYFTASNGKWKEGNISGWRQDYNLYFKRNTIQLSKKLTLDVGAGYERRYYGYDNSSNNIWRFNTKLTARPNDRLETWVGYAYNDQSGTSVYEYDKIDSDRELKTGFMYKVDKMNSVGVKIDYEVDAGRLKDLDYTWRRNLHCWEADITYREKRNQLNVKLSTIAW